MIWYFKATVILGMTIFMIAIYKDIYNIQMLLNTLDPILKTKKADGKLDDHKSVYRQLFIYFVCSGSNNTKMIYILFIWLR